MTQRLGKDDIMRVVKTGLAMTATLGLLAVSPLPAAAASTGAAVKAGVAAASADELSARKRYRGYRGYRSGNAAAARTFGAIAGTVGGIIAAEQARSYYRRQYSPYGYGYGPYGYGGPYGYYGGGYAPYSYYDRY